MMFCSLWLWQAVCAFKRKPYLKTIKKAEKAPEISGAYHYENFKDRESIRVLTLLPSKSLETPIHIKLSIQKLTHDLEYEALSYTWGTINGDASLCCAVVYDGKEIKVTQNCVDALKRLRREDDERILWVDAICIDQQNDTEKAHQVAAMGRIYRYASNVAIWLGDASETIDVGTGLPISDLFFDYLSRMLIEFGKLQSKGENPNTAPLYRGLLSQAADYVSNGSPTPLVQGFLDVVRRPWWERVWVVQEAAMAGSAILTCGGKSANYKDLYDLWDVVRRDNSHESGLTYSLLDGYKHHMYSIWQVKENMNFSGPANVLQRVLDRCRRLRSTDQRDYIFAMLGMFKSIASQLPVPDYSANSEEVFATMTARFIDLLGSLHVLENVTNIDLDSTFPSWVIDFSQRPQFHIPIRDTLYHASGDSPAISNVSDDFKELRLLGKCVAVLENVQKAPLEGYFNPYIPQKAILGYQQSCKVGGQLTTYFTNEDPQDVVWRTLCWNVDVEYRCPATDELRDPFANFQRALLSGKDVETIEKEMLLEDSRDFNNICVHSMPLCITSNGYLASVPWTAETGDIVVIFSGAHVPYVLRKDAILGHYRLLGSCYVHGIMEGEAFPKDPSQMEWFSIR